MNGRFDLWLCVVCVFFHMHRWAPLTVNWYCLNFHFSIVIRLPCNVKEAVAFHDMENSCIAGLSLASLIRARGIIYMYISFLIDIS